MTLHAHAKKSARTYVAALLEAAQILKVDPIKLLLDTAEVRGAHKIEMLEFLVGWFHGCAEQSGQKVEVLWRELTGAPATARPKPRRAGVVRARPSEVVS